MERTPSGKIKIVFSSLFGLLNLIKSFIVSSGASKKCLIQLAYAIGVSKPLSIFIKLAEGDQNKVDSIKIPKNFSQLNDGSNLTCFLKEDNYFEKLWFEYHAKFAKLRILCKECNLQRNKY